MIWLNDYMPSVPVFSSRIEVGNIFEAIPTQIRDEKGVYVLFLAFGQEYSLTCHVSDACKAADLHRLEDMSHDGDRRFRIRDEEKAHWRTLLNSSQSFAIVDGDNDVPLHFFRVKLFPRTVDTGDRYAKELYCR